MSAVVSTEEYAAKIIKLQQACLVPLKEDLADWLNKILKTSNITTDNFMENLDNGVIICRLAKIISLWCEQQLTTQDQSEEENAINTKGFFVTTDRRDCGHASPIIRNTPAYKNGPLRSATSQSINCLVTSASATSLNNGASYQNSANQFISNLIKMHQTKIWEDAKCRTFYARDNVCNFIKWSKDFGVNQSVLFESDDLVLHANPRQVVLCLLDVARIAYVKYGFTEAPGLVKFEQEIDKELAFENTSSKRVYSPQAPFCWDNLWLSDKQPDDEANKKLSSRSRNSFDVPVDKTDELVLRYCRHKEEEAARKRSQEIELAEAARVTASSASSEKTSTPLEVLETNTMHEHLTSGAYLFRALEDEAEVTSSEPNVLDTLDTGPLTTSKELSEEDILELPLTTPDLRENHNVKNLIESGRNDSLDSGEGQTESASTGHSSQLPDNISVKKTQLITNSAIPVPQRPANLSPSITSRHTSSMTQSELSSSRSSLLSNQDGNNSFSKYGRPITSDLDGKVMRIAKSYYGKKATKDVTRLSEGKYKIADRIVFVRLLKGHRVMVRIGGGWDTLENFLFRHKSDPSQIIDPDNLLPLETKMPFEKSPQVTPTRTSRLPYYRRSNSASTTNLSLSNLSSSNHSLITSTTPAIRGSERVISKSIHSSPMERNTRQMSSHLSLQKGPIANSRLKINSVQEANSKQQQSTQQLHSSHSIHYNGSHSNIKRPIYYARRIK